MIFLGLVSTEWSTSKLVGCSNAAKQRNRGIREIRGKETGGGLPAPVSVSFEVAQVPSFAAATRLAAVYSPRSSFSIDMTIGAWLSL